MNAWEIIFYYLYVLLLIIGMLVFWIVVIVTAIAVACLIMKIMIYNRKNICER